MPIGKSIRVYLSDATASGIRYAELVNWTGQALACPRNQLVELSSWPEASKPGVYLLFEARLGDSKPLAYIGESENVAERLTTHDRLKEFWNEVVIFTSKDENLTKAHVKFLESTLVTLAKRADRYELENGNTPQESSLPRADRDAMAEFVENVRMVIGTLGYPILEPLLRSQQASTQLASTSELEVATKIPSLDLTFRVNNLTAHGTLTNEGFVLQKGSQVSRSNTDSAAQRVVKMKEQLIADGRLVSEGDHLLLNEDFLLSSSSYAAIMVAGTSRSGPQSWMSSDGRTLKSIEDSAVQDA
jgi:hypothetical protein